jgi:hypothetical protein
MVNLKLTDDELFNLTEIVGNSIQFDEDLIPLYKKLLKLQKPIDMSKQDFDYEIPEYKGQS